MSLTKHVARVLIQEGEGRRRMPGRERERDSPFN